VKFSRPEENTMCRLKSRDKYEIPHFKTILKGDFSNYGNLKSHDLR